MSSATTINCPSCGAANQRGYRLCSQCGQPMPAQTSLRCPECGAANPIGNAYCDQCNARLTPGAAPTTGDARPPGPAQDAMGSGGLLAKLDLPSVKETPGGPAASRGPAESFEMPDWLQDLEPDTDFRAATQADTPVVQPPELDVTPDEPGGASDWLAELAPDEAVQAPPLAEAPIQPSSVFGRAEVPEWLLEMAPPEVGRLEPSPARPEPASKPGVPGAAEIPDWLLDVAPPEAPAAEPPTMAPAAEPPPAAPQRDEAPEWLRDMAAGEAAPVPETPAAPAPSLSGEVPDWLRDVAAGEAAPAPEPPALPAAPLADEAPDWLRAIAAAEEAPARRPPVVAVEAGQAPTAPADGLGVPDWLQELEPEALIEMADPGTEPPLAMPAVEVAPAGVDDVPDWLRQVAPPEAGPVAEAVPGTPLAPAAATAAEPPGEDAAALVPDWLVDLKLEGPQPEAPARPPVTVQPGLAEDPGLARAEIPGWLEEMRPQPQVPGAVVEEEPVETEGLLEGLRGVLPAAPIELPAPDAQAPARETSEVAAARAQLLQSLLAPRVERPRVEPKKRAASTGEMLVRWRVLAAVVIPVAVVAGWPAMAQEGEVLVLTEPQPGEAADLYAAVDSLEPGDVALVAFEYGAGEAGELNLLAKPILWHLNQKGAVVKVRSTDPSGQAIADALRREIRATEEYTPTFESSAYVAGGATGVARMLRDPALQPDLVIVLAGQFTPVRWWLEQTRALDGGPPVVAAVGASVLPVASPYEYANGGQLAGLVGGLAGAAAYESQLGSSLTLISALLNGLATGHVAVAALLIVGAVAYAIGGTRKREGA
ncbi:MAG: hypothetical protein E3J64_03420 [Anaerolineales bacterium]|nr:MAG: hypothetical protein E3J64_03420 [Anaerolineales bacterium]